MAGGSSTAGKWILILAIYFFVFILLVTSISNMSSNITYSGDDFSNKSSAVSYSCDTPRYMYDSNFQEIKNHYPNTNNCDKTRGVFHEELCNSINGCSWDNVTVGGWFGFGGSEIESCTGNINTSYYNNGSTSSDVCGLQDMQTDENRCNLMGCTYYETVGVSAIGGVDTFFTTIVEMVTFQADIGMPAGYNYIFIFIFFWLPLLSLILAIYMAVRG